MRVALLLNERQFADARIRLTQCDTVLFGEPHQALSRAMHQPRVGRKGDRFFLHDGVDDHLGKVGRLGGSRPGRGRKALLQQATSFSSPIRWRQRVIEDRSKGSLCWKNSSPQNS